MRFPWPGKCDRAAIAGLGSLSANRSGEFNPGSRRWLRDVDRNLRTGRAFVSGAVDSGHGVPKAMPRLDRRITNCRSEQHFGSKRRAPCALLLTSIDAVAGQVGFCVDGPGEVNLERATGAGENRS